MADAGEPNDVRARPSPARWAAVFFLSSRATTSLFFFGSPARVATRAGATRADRLAYSSRVRAYAGAGAVRAPARRAHRRERGEDAPTTPSTARVRASLALNPLRLGRRGRRGPGRARQAPPPRGAARPERHPGATGARVPHGASPPQGRQLRRARRPRPTVVQASPSRRPRGRALPRCDRRPGYRAGEPRVEVHERLGRAQPRDPQRGAYAIPPRVVSPFPRTTTTPQTHSCARFARDDARS